MPWRIFLLVLAFVAASVVLAGAESRTMAIRPGDAPERIAKRHHVSVPPLPACNLEGHAHRLPVGGTLVIRAVGSEATTAVLPDEEPPGVRYVVAPGDYPAAIAAKFGIDLDALERANPGLDARRLLVGHVLVIPPAVPDAPPPVTVSRPGMVGQSAPLVMDFQ